MCTVMICRTRLFFFFNDTATTEIYTLSLHDALPIYSLQIQGRSSHPHRGPTISPTSTWDRSPPLLYTQQHPSRLDGPAEIGRAHSELQSRQYLVCRLLLEKKKTILSSLTNTD